MRSWQSNKQLKISVPQIVINKVALTKAALLVKFDLVAVLV